MKSDSELQKLRYDNEDLREAADRLWSRIEALEAALREIIDNPYSPPYEIARAALAPDLVKRLRTGPYDRFDPRKDQELEAADRIEALEAALREIAHDARAEITPSWAAKIARAALAPEQDK